MADRTVVDRVKRQRDVRLLEGWQEVRVWVPTDEDAEDIRNIAATRRAKAEALHGLIEGVPSMSPETLMRISEAISAQGSAAYTTPSGPVLELLSKLADEGDLTGFSRAFVIFARAKPVNAAFVANATPAKIVNYLNKHRGIPYSALQTWTNSHPDWADGLKNALRDPMRFEQAVDSIASSIDKAQAATD